MSDDAWTRKASGTREAWSPPNRIQIPNGKPNGHANGYTNGHASRITPVEPVAAAHSSSHANSPLMDVDEGELAEVLRAEEDAAANEPTKTPVQKLTPEPGASSPAPAEGT